jgi:hypothetical protein
VEGNVNLASGDFQRLLREQAKWNRLNQRDPFGNTLEFGPGGVTQEMGPEQRRLYRRLTRQAAKPLSLRDFAPGDFGEQMRAAEGATFDRAMALLNPQFDLQEQRTAQELANRGLPDSSRAYQSRVGLERDTRNRATEQAALASILAGQDIQGQAFGQQLAGHQQNTGQRLDQYQMPFARQMSLMQLAQPSYAAIPGVDVLGAYSPMLQADMAQKAQNFSFGRHVLPGLINMGSRIGSAYMTG